jgi:hypothetical protein
MRAGSGIAVLVLFGALFLSISPVQANQSIPEHWGYKLLGPVSLVLGGFGVFSTSLPAFIDVVQNKKPSSARNFKSGAFGLLNCIAGIAYIASGDNEFAVGFGTTHLVLGVFGLGTAFWGGFISEEQDLTVSPVVFPSAPGIDVDSSAFGVVVSGRF